MTSAVVKEPSTSSGPGDSCSLVHPPKRWAYNSWARKSFDHYFTDKLEIISACIYLDATSMCIYISSFMLRSPYLPNTVESRCYWVFLATSCWDNWGHYQSTDGAFSPKVAWVINCLAAYLILFSLNPQICHLLYPNLVPRLLGASCFYLLFSVSTFLIPQWQLGVIESPNFLPLKKKKSI